MFPTSKKVLRCAISLKKSGDSYPTIDRIVAETKMDQEEVIAACHDLINAGYVEFTYYVNSNVVNGIRLTIRGLHPFQDIWINLKSYLLQNLIALLALVVSAISLIISIAKQ